MRICEMCEKEIVGKNFRAFDGKGSFRNTCSIECLIECEKMTSNMFNEYLEDYRNSYKELNELLSKNNEDNSLDEAINKHRDNIEALEHIYGFSKDMLHKQFNRKDGLKYV